MAVVLLVGGLGACSSNETTTPGETTNGRDTTTFTTTATAVGPEQVTSEAALYEAPDPIPDLPHGTLLRYQVMADSVSDAGTTYRIMYASRSLDDDPIVVTGVAVVPDAGAPVGGRPILSIGHGTTGIADRCAPSRLPPREALLGALAVQHDWVTAISDYEGLGTPGRHPYLVGESAGRSVLDAATAAAQLPRADTSDQLLLAGYSQGGQAVLFAGEAAPQWTPDLEVVGVAAGAPVSGLVDLLEGFFDGPQAGFAYMALAGANAAFPDEADLSTVLTPTGLEWLDVVDEGCKAEVFDAVAAHTGSDLRTATGITAEPWRSLIDRSEPGRRTHTAPILVLHNPADEVIPIAYSDRLVTRLCAADQLVELRLLAENTHLDAGPAAFTASFDWFTALLDGEPATTTCPAP